MVANERVVWSGLPERGRAVDSLALRRTEFRFKVSFDERPFLIDDAEANRISLSAVGHDALVANDALFFGTQAKNRIARLQVRFIGRELNPYASHIFKGRPEQKELRFGVDESSLPRCSKPRAADFELSILAINLPEPGGADDLAGFAHHCDEGLNSAGCKAV